MIELKGIAPIILIQPEKEVDDSFRPNMAIESISRFGLVEISFDQSLVVPQDWNQIDEEVLDFRVNPYDEE